MARAGQLLTKRRDLMRRSSIHRLQFPTYPDKYHPPVCLHSAVLTYLGTEYSHRPGKRPQKAQPEHTVERAEYEVKDKVFVEGTDIQLERE